MTSTLSLRAVGAVTSPQDKQSSARGPGDALYVLVRGRLRVDAESSVLHEIRPGELFGEIAVVTRKPRTTSVYTVRDSELLVLPAVAFEELVERKPDIFREVARVLVDRLLTVDRPVTGGNASLVVAVVPVTRDPQLVEEALRELLEAFARYGSAACGRRQDLPEGRGLVEWARQLEMANRYVVYVAGPEEPEWFTSCVRQADRVLMLAERRAHLVQRNGRSGESPSWCRMHQSR